MCKRVCVCFFSPCGNVKKIAERMGKRASEILGCPLALFDFTLPAGRKSTIAFGNDDFVILGVPTYAGRIPNKIAPFVEASIRANNSKAIAVVSFGNRSYDDALDELVFLMRKNGFDVVGATAVVSEHSFASELATQRPNEVDMAELDSFVGKVMGKKEIGLALGDLSEIGKTMPEKYYTPLRIDNEPAKFLKAVPVVDQEKCNHCMKCTFVCPMGSVDLKDPSMTNGICIKCQACIHACPQKARFFDNEDFLSHREMLKKNYGKSRLTSEYFV